MNDIKTTGHEEVNEDGQHYWNPGYQRRACLLCIAEKVRGATPLEMVSFICGEQLEIDSCGQHREPLMKRAHEHDVAPDFGQEPNRT